MKGGPAGKWTRASAVGIEMAVAIVLGLMGGAWADEKLGTDPWLALVGLLLGSGVGFRALFRVASSSDDGE